MIFLTWLDKENFRIWYKVGHFLVIYQMIICWRYLFGLLWSPRRTTFLNCWKKGGGQRFARTYFRYWACENISKSSSARKTESKSKWAVNLFISWLENRQENNGNRNGILQIQRNLLTMDQETHNYWLGALITKVCKKRVGHTMKIPFMKLS